MGEVITLTTAWYKFKVVIYVATYVRTHFKINVLAINIDLSKGKRTDS